MNESSTADRPLRLLLVGPVPPPFGGIGRGLLMLKAWLEGREDVDFRILNIAPRGRGAADSGLWKRVVFGGAQVLEDAPKFVVRLLADRPAVVHLKTSASLALIRDVALAVCSGIFRTPFIYHIHMGRLPQIAARKGWEWRLISFVLRRAATVVVLDQASEEAARTCRGVRMVTRIPNAVEPASAEGGDTLHATRPGMKRAVFLGWVVPTKGTGELIEAWNAAADETWELLVVGPGDEAYIRDLQSRVRPGAKVRFPGEVLHGEALEILKSADAFVFPSHSEGFPNAVLEAMAASLAIASTPVGAIAEILGFGGSEPCGLEVPVGDPAALEEALRTLMRDEALRTELGRRARRKVETAYRPDVVFPRLLALWTAAAARPRRRKEGACSPEKHC
jgi:glycosyltransferase involved in cell wall biosynthesis